MGAVMRAYDWSNSPLGPPDSWPQPLKTLVGVMLGADQPMFIGWGADHILLYNDGYAPMLADRHPGALGRPFFDVWPEVRDELTPLFDAVARGEPVHMADLSLELDRPGRHPEAHFAFSYTPVRSETGEIDGLFCACTETTEQVVADRQSSAARNRLFEMTRDLFGVATFDGYLKTINPAWASILGRSHDELTSRPFSDIIHPDDLDATGSVIETLMRGEPVHQFLVRLLKADGTPISFAWSATPDSDPGSGIFYTVGRDITEEQNREEMLRQSQKMEAVGQLTGGLAHDFNNLLTGMMGNLELLQMRVARGRTDDLDRFISAAQGAGRRAASLTQRLLAFSRRQTLDPRPTDVAALVRGMEDLLRRTVGPECAIEVIDAPGLWPAMIDGTQLESALLNLCINARDAMPGGGRITIEAANKRLDQRAARQHDIDPGEYLSICVTDAGTGMEPQVVERAFEPFFTTKPIGQGTGLGLSMVYGFARQSGGQVRIYSEVGMGTTICIYLPRYDGEATNTAGDDVLPENMKGSGETILVVDDEATIRHLIDEVLDEQGYTVIGAGDGAAGIKVLQSGARIDLLITDVGLPNGMNGRQVADAARSLRPGLKVLFITGYAENAAVGNGHLEPGMELLTKPFTIEALSMKVAEILRQA
ncbi:hybrid sensor histidine kinase/response regulator [Sphingomonas phyllosphaerae]|uniref:hybrid sensor histidine kinase/response regulator n=1 Tax=Sphingomonas phyllosphaerae TaxID=257003 RepID=UPI0004051252|nr:ATP-binding protein [Sphingomonas phyllosphaerae]